MIDLRRRITGVDEIMDNLELPADQLAPVLSGLERLNKWFGGHKTIIKALKHFPVHANDHVSDWGCGGGDVLRAIAQWAAKKGLPLRYTGVDAAASAVHIARERNAGIYAINYQQADVLNTTLDQEYDVVISNLFTHHFEDEVWVQLIGNMLRCSRRGVIITDLHRHWLLYYSLQVIFRSIIPNKIMLYDGPLSVRRGFKRVELERLLAQAGVTHYQIKWKWAFQWLVVIHKT